MKSRILASVFLMASVFTATGAHAQEGMISVESPFDVATTLEKLTTVLEAKGMNVFGRVNHAQNAQSVDLELRPTELLIFGNPAAGTPLMNCAQSVAIDLPQKMLAWQDEAGTTHLGWNDPMYLKSRHGIEGCDEALEKISMALSGFAAAATRE